MNEQSSHIQIFQEQQEDVSHLRDYWVVFKRRGWIIPLAIIVVLGASIAYLSRVPKQYEATAMVKLPSQGGGGLPMAFGFIIPRGQSEHIATEMEMIKGRTLAENVIRKLKLDKKEKNLKLDPRLITLIFRASLRVSQRGRSSLIAITAGGDSPEEAKKITNEVVDEYIRMSGISSQKLLKELGKEMSSRLKEAEENLAEYRTLLHDREAEQGITTAFGPLLIGGGTSIQARAGGFGTQYMIPEALQAVAKLKGSIIEMEVQLELLRQSLPEAHPNIINLKDQIAVSKKKLEEEQEKAIEKYDKQFNLTEDAADVIFGQQLYAALVAKQEELKAQILMQNRVPEVTERAIEPLSHSRPRKTIILMAAMLLGLFLGVSAALFWEFVDSSMHTSKDVTKLTDLPVIGRIPRLRGASRRRIIKRSGKRNPRRGILINTVNSTRRDRKMEIYKESYRMLQLGIMASANGKLAPANSTQRQGALALLVTSSVPGEGKSSVAANLAVSIAQTGRRVLLVDANCRGSVQHELLGVDNGTGLIDVLTGNAAWDDVVKDTSLDNLYLVTTGGESSQADPSSILMSTRIDDFVEASKEQFDFVIFDSAPVTLASESVAIGSRIDGVMLVIKANGTRGDDILEAKQRVQSSGGNILGAVLNC